MEGGGSPFHSIAGNSSSNVSSPTEYGSGDYAWTMASAALVFMMIPGIALFYSGLRSQNTALSLIWLNMMVSSVVTIQWYLFGYSLVFSSSSNSQYVGNFDYAVFRGTTAPGALAGVGSPGIPAMVFGLFQSMFAAFTASLVTGVIAEKGRLLPFLVFAFFWTCFVYDPIAYWMWNADGWANKAGALDWAGGTPVHICSGAASLAYTLVLRRLRIVTSAVPEDEDMDDEDDPHRREAQQKGTWKQFLFPSRRSRRRRAPAPPAAVEEIGLEGHNMTNALLGAMLVWFGWFGFNAGSELRANSRAASTFIASNLAASSGGITFTLLEQYVARNKWSGVGFCTGAFVGLVAITPGAGWVPAWAGLIFGSTASVICFGLMAIKPLKRYLEEPLDISIVHGAGGLWGMFLTGIFADKTVAALDGTVIPGGAISGNAKQIVWQLAGGFAGFGWSFVVTLILLTIIQLLSTWFPSLELRAKTSESSHLDDEELADTAAYKIDCRSCLYRPIPPARTPTPSSNLVINSAAPEPPPQAPQAQGQLRSESFRSNVPPQVQDRMYSAESTVYPSYEMDEQTQARRDALWQARNGSEPAPESLVPTQRWRR